MGLVVAGSALAGCGGSSGTDDAASSGPASSSAAGTTTADTTSAGTSSTPTTEPADSTGVPPFPADTSPDTAEPSAPAGLTVTDVRIGRHEGFDRVVLELGGAGTPGWDVEYVDAATAEGSGKPIDLAGPAYLRVLLTGTSYPYETGLTEVPRGPVATAGATVVSGAFYDATFEGQSLAYVGTRTQKPFRVYALSNPTRVVVEVAAAG